MSSLRIKKFFLDYLIGSGLTFLLLIALIGDVTLLDSKAMLGLFHQCSSDFSQSEVLQLLQPSLKKGEVCEVVSPCKEMQSIQCTGTIKVFEVPQTFFLFERLDFRAKDALAETYGVYHYRFNAARRIPLNTMFALLVFSIFITEAGAIIFALWRQKGLSAAFSLGSDFNKIKLLKPVMYATLWSLFVIIVNQLVYDNLDHPGIEQSELIKVFSSSLLGAVFAIFLAPFAEELMFRGVFLRFFIERGRASLGVLLVSIGFALLHGFSETSVGSQIFTSSIFFFGSVILCVLYIKSKSLWPPIIFHSTYNSVMLTYFNVFG